MTHIVSQRSQSAGVDRDQSILAELGLSNLQNPVGQVHVRAIQPQCFPGPQSSARQEANHGRQGSSPQGVPD